MSWSKRICGAIADEFLCLFVIFPLAIFHWRGTWHLQDVYVFPKQYVLSCWTSATVGSVLSVFLMLIHPAVTKWLTDKPRWVYVIGIRLYLFFSAWAILGYWRGFWNLIDYYLTEGWVNSLILYAIAEVLSLGFRTSRTNAGLPMSLQLDRDEDLLKPDTRFASQTSSSCCKYFLDVLFTQFIIVSLNIIVWRGLWNMIDTFIFPENELVSDVSSLILGYLTCIMLFLMEYPASRASARLDDSHIIFKLAFEGMLMVCGTWSILLLWRGAWNLVKTYVIPDPMVGGWVCHVVGVFGLMVLQGYSNVGTNGIDIDGSYKEGQGIYPTEYLRYFLSRGTSKVKYSELQSLAGDTAEKSLQKLSMNNYDADSESSSSDLEEYLPVDLQERKLQEKKLLNGHSKSKDGSHV